MGISPKACDTSMVSILRQVTGGTREAATCSRAASRRFLVDKDRYLLELCRYVVLNPVRASTSGVSSTFGVSSNIETFSHAWRRQIPALKTLNINLVLA